MKKKDLNSRLHTLSAEFYAKALPFRAVRVAEAHFGSRREGETMNDEGAMRP